MGRFSKLETSQAADKKKPEQPTAGAPMAAAEEELSYDANYYCLSAEREFLAGNYRRALQLFSRAAQVESTHVDAWTGQILALLAEGEKREALAWVRRAVELFPEEGRIAALQGLVYAHHGMVNRGLQCSDFAMERKASDPWVWFFRGQVLALAQNANAPFCMEKAMDMRPADDWRIPAHIGLFYLERRSYALAEKYLSTATSLNSSEAALWYRLGRAQLGLAKWELARRSFETALQLAPHFRPAVVELESLNRSPMLARLIAFFLGRRKNSS
ncbi:MAG: tetratricopeptide repeat protein [Candidatus Sumerlaeaceae bacterium]|jgi:tetratricopeptide (TPR) repeat protein